METKGSNCFYQSLLANSEATPDAQAMGNEAVVKADAVNGVTVAHLSKLTSRATCLGATSPSAGVVELAKARAGGVRTVCVSDEESMQAGLDYLSESPY